MSTFDLRADIMRRQCSLLVSNLRLRGAPIVRWWRRDLSIDSHELSLELRSKGRTQTAVVKTPVVDAPPFGRVGVLEPVILPSEKFDFTVLVPSHFVVGTDIGLGPQSFFSVLEAHVLTILCEVDILALLSWAVGELHDDEVTISRTNWSMHTPSGLSGFETTVPHLDIVLGALVGALSGEPKYPLPAGVVVTGDTDEASQAELLEFTQLFTAAKVPITLLIRHENQITPALLRAGGELLDFGVHPFAEDDTYEAFGVSLRRLTSKIRSITGSNPVACRHHKFQWFSPPAVRSLLAELGIQCELNLVSVSGESWLGAPTGLSFATGSRSIVIFPTVVEDEVFLYDCDYSFKYSADLYSKWPVGVVLRFLDHWVLSMERPACVNLHPEHCTSEFRRLQDAVLAWVNDNQVETLRLTDLVGTIRQSFDRI